MNWLDPQTMQCCFSLIVSCPRLALLSYSKSSCYLTSWLSSSVVLHLPQHTLADELQHRRGRCVPLLQRLTKAPTFFYCVFVFFPLSLVIRWVQNQGFHLPISKLIQNSSLPGCVLAILRLYFFVMLSVSVCVCVCYGWIVRHSCHCIGHPKKGSEASPESLLRWLTLTNWVWLSLVCLLASYSSRVCCGGWRCWLTWWSGSGRVSHESGGRVCLSEPSWSEVRWGLLSVM